ncbi:unnamed protein product [Aureobasidium mustum]|uniref:Uncharacterized protein n=1 Tax=Aureobasidium mustum TaxID=2773714 RepID=A0A9N8JJ45_9PEZI|nr:unnamed protein product [Aureobasidium mustum]
MDNPRTDLDPKPSTAAARRTRFIDPPRGTLLNPDVSADIKAQRLSIYGHRLMSNRDLRVVEVAEIMMDWASDDNQPDLVREGFPLNGVVGLNLVINDFDDVLRRYTRDSEVAFNLFAHEWKWRPPVLRSFTPMEVGRWEMEIYNIFYNYCLRPVEFEGHAMNQFIAWLCSSDSVPRDMRIEVERARLGRCGGIKYSDLLAYVKAMVDQQPEEVQRKKRLLQFFANSEPPRLGAISPEAFARYRRDIIKLTQTNRDILVLWDAQFASWLKRGLQGFPKLVSSIERRAFELAIRLDEHRPPSCKDVHFMFGDLLVVIDNYIIHEHELQTEIRPGSLTEQSDDEVELEDMINEILHNEREIHHQRAEIRRKQAENRGTVEDDRRLYLLGQKGLKCVKMLNELQQAQRRRKIKFEQQAMQRNRVSMFSLIRKPNAQDIEAQRAALREVIAPQQHCTSTPNHRPFYLHASNAKPAGASHDPEHERQQRCRMAEIRRQRLTRRTR